jgi:hypothetical protein
MPKDFFNAFTTNMLILRTEIQNQQDSFKN